MDEKYFSLNELCMLTGVSRRTVRYYMQIGLVSRPSGETRAARYHDHHLEQLLTIKRMTSAGMSLESIRVALNEVKSDVAVRTRTPGSLEVRTHLFIAPGIELQITPAEAKLTPDQVRILVSEIMEIAQRTFSASTSEDEDP